jgi:hypothetical protein
VEQCVPTSGTSKLPLTARLEFMHAYLGAMYQACNRQANFKPVPY